MTDVLLDTLPGWLETRYELPSSPDLRLLRRWTNDVYLVELPNRRFALKVYGGGWRGDDEIRFELDLLQHLNLHGVAVAMPVAGVDGNALQHLNLDAVRRQAVLYSWAPGIKPRPPFTPDQYWRFGRATAEMHRAADTFRTHHYRRPLDLAWLIDGPLALTATLDVSPSTRRVLEQTGIRLHAELAQWAKGDLDWGVCHADVTFDNIHIDTDGTIVWYDFDSGGYGWRAIDLQGWAHTLPDRIPDQVAFIEGYREVRPIDERNVHAAPWLTAAQELWGMQTDLERRALGQGTDAVQARCAAVAASLTRWCEVLRIDLY